MSGQEVQDITYPSILFRLRDDYYALGCKNVASIMQMPEYEMLPHAPENVVGIFKFRDEVIPIISLRTLFGMPTRESEANQFTSMIDQRKQDHIDWVKELHKSINNGVPFTLAADPHKCAFGRWYDKYEPQSQNIKFHFKKIETPHRLLHECASEVQSCTQDCDNCRRKECLKKVMNNAEGVYMPQILQLLDEAKDIFTQNHRSMLIVINTGSHSFALIVDDVLSVEDLKDVASEQQVDKLKGSRYISEIKRSAKTSRLVLMIDDLKLAEISETYKLEEEIRA